MTDRERLYAKAAMHLSGPRGAYCAGWLDGYNGREPDAQKWQRQSQVADYDKGWLAGAEQREALEGDR